MLIVKKKITVVCIKIYIKKKNKFRIEYKNNYLHIQFIVNRTIM